MVADERATQHAAEAEAVAVAAATEGHLTNHLTSPAGPRRLSPSRPGSTTSGALPGAASGPPAGTSRRDPPAGGPPPDSKKPRTRHTSEAFTNWTTERLELPMTATAEATAPPAASLTPRQMQLRIARMTRKGLPAPTSCTPRSTFAANANLAKWGHEQTATGPSVHLHLASSADLTAWAAALDLRVECNVFDLDGEVWRSETASGRYEGWTVHLHILGTTVPSLVVRPASHRARRRARAAIVGRLV